MDFAFGTVQQREAIVGVAATDKLLDDFLGLQDKATNFGYYGRGATMTYRLGPWLVS